MIRPESIHVVLPEAAPPGSLRATTVQTSFLGSYTRVAVRCEAVDDPVLVAVHGKGEIAVDALDIDKEVALWWRPDDDGARHRYPTRRVHGTCANHHDHSSDGRPAAAHRPGAAGGSPAVRALSVCRTQATLLYLPGSMARMVVVDVAFSSWWEVAQ